MTKMNVREIADIGKTSSEYVRNISHEHAYEKICSRRVQLLETKYQSQQSIDDLERNFAMVQSNRNAFVTMDETWIYHYTPASNRCQLSCWSQAKATQSYQRRSNQM